MANSALFLQKTFPTSAKVDLSLAYNLEECIMESIQFEYLNLIAAYMLHALAWSQSMGKLLYAFKNVLNMEKFLEENAHAPDGSQPILTPAPWPRDHGIRYFSFLQLRMPPCEQQYLEGQGFSCIGAGYVGPRDHV